MRRTIGQVLEETKIMVIDGAMSTALEELGCDLNDALWSAKVLIESPEKIKEVHKNYFAAGADCSISASYQATIPGFIKRGFTEAEAESLIVRSVELLKEAREEWWEESGKAAGRAYPITACAVGPYGAYLADGSEYKGNYGVSDEVLREFHKRRMELLWNAGGDILAIETIPSMDEAILLAEMVEEMGAGCWITFSCKNETEVCEGQKISDCAKALSKFKCVQAIGINCTAPHLVASLIGEIKQVCDTPVIVYPNSGAEYDPETKTWSRPEGCKPYGEFAKDWKDAGAELIGGCCCTTAKNICEVHGVVRGE